MTPYVGISIRAEIIARASDGHPGILRKTAIGVAIQSSIAIFDKASATFDYTLVDRLDNALSICLAKFFEICLAAHVHSITRIGDKGMLDDYSRNAPFASTIYHRVVVCNAAVRVLRTVFRIARLHTSIGEPQSSQLRNNLLSKRLASYMSVMIVATIVGNPHLTAFRCRRGRIDVKGHKNRGASFRCNFHSLGQTDIHVT